MRISAFYEDIFVFFIMHCFKNETLFELWHNETNKDSKILAIFNHAANILTEEDLDLSWDEKLKEKIRIFCSNVTIKWQNAHRNFNNSKSKHSNWLQVETVFDHLNTDADIVFPPNHRLIVHVFLMKKNYCDRKGEKQLTCRKRINNMILN